MGHIERRQKEKENTKNSIVRAALDIAIKDGWNAVTIRKIAKAIEYTPPIVYEYFKNKEDLMNELVGYGHKLLHKGYDNAFKEKDIKKTLLRLSLNLWDFAFEHKELFQLMFNIGRRPPDENIKLYASKIRSLFYEIYSDKNTAEEVMFSFVCIQQGYIYGVKQMGLPPDFVDENPRDVYIRAMERFISYL